MPGNDQILVIIVCSLLTFYVIFFPSSPSPLSSSSPPRPSSNVELQRLRLEINQLKEMEDLVRLSLEEAKVLQGLSRSTSGDGGSNSGEQRGAVPPPPPSSPLPPLPPAPPSSSSSPLKYLASSPNEPNRPTVNVLLYNKFEGYLDWWREEDFMKPAREKCSTVCKVTKDRSMASTADVILFHVKTHSKGDFPARVNDEQKWGYVSLEQPGYAPLVNDQSYTSRFDYSLTYDLSSSIPTITVSPHFTAQQYHDAQVLPFAEKDGFGEPNAVAAFVSNCKAAGANKRLEMMQELAKHIPLHSYGGCLNNKKEPPMAGCKPGDKACNKQKVLQKYKFYLSFENDIIKDYVSEKVFDGLLGGTLPIYRGAESIDKFMPSERSPAVVKMSDFGDDMKALADHLNMLAGNEVEYNKYFQWKKEDALDRFQSVLDMTAYKYTSLCRICQKVLEDRGSS